MIDRLERILNCKQHLRDKIQLLIDIFTSFYGEEKRDEITKKFNDALLIAYRSPESTNLILSRLSIEHTNDILQSYIENLSFFKIKDFLNESNFEFYTITPIYGYYCFYEQYKLGKEGRKQKYIDDSYSEIKKYLPELTKEEFEEMIKTRKILDKYKNIRSWLKENIKYYIDLENAEKRYVNDYNKIEVLLHKIDPNITLENYSEHLDDERLIKLNSIAEQFPIMLEEYNKRMSKYNKYIQERDSNRELRSTLEKSYYIKFVEENIDLLSEDDKAFFEKYKLNPNNSLNLTPYTKYLFGYALSSNTPLDAFSEQSQTILDNDSELSWKKDTIKNERIEYFKRSGIDLGDDYEAYVNNPEVQKIWPSSSRIEKFIESRNRLLNEFNIEYYSSSPEYREIREEIDSRQLLDKEDSFRPKLFTQNAKTMVNPNIIQTDRGFELSPLVIIMCNYLDNNIDHNLIHELNHLYELYLMSVEEDSYSVICGWDVLRSNMNQGEKEAENTLEDKRERRDYELFNEITNELIAQEICKLLEERNQHIFDSEDDYQYKNTTSYEYTFFIVREFFKEYKKEILESRSEGNIQIIWDAVGKENFDELNELFHIYNDNFSGYSIYTLLHDLKNNRDTELTRIYHDIEKRRDEILEHMREHYDSKKEGKAK